MLILQVQTATIRMIKSTGGEQTSVMSTFDNIFSGIHERKQRETSDHCNLSMCKCTSVFWDNRHTVFIALSSKKQLSADLFSGTGVLNVLSLDYKIA